MSTNDITMEQFETLVLIRLMKEFITDEKENLRNLSEVIYSLEENLPEDEHEKFVENTCKLTERGYLVSDATKEHMENDWIPEVEGITPKGQTALEDWESNLKKDLQSGKKIVFFENFSLFNINLLNVPDTSILKTAGGIFKNIADAMRGRI